MEKRDSLQAPLPIADLALPLDTEPPRTRRIYCNRDLRLDQIEVIGFDMDYTLAIYRQEEIDQLSIEATAQKLVARGYPPSLLQMSYATKFPIRGLLVDTKFGNVIKTDRYRYAKKAYHGTRALTSDERKQLYQGKRIRPGPNYHSIDTLYALSEVTVFSAVVDTLDAGGTSVEYPKLFQDVRDCIDEAHRDGTIKTRILGDLGRYIERDPDLPATLHKLRSAGKRLFLLTNSELAYTDKVMRYLLDKNLSEYRSWRSYFDAIISDARKPSFFTGSGLIEAHDTPGVGTKELLRGRIYLGGCLTDFERLLNVRGDHVLYVGDHIFGDVLRAKKESAWRTLMIIQEMTDELAAMERFAPDIERLRRLEERHYALLDGMRDRQTLLKSLTRKLGQNGLQPPEKAALEATRVRLRHAIESVRSQVKAVDEEYTALGAELESAHHPFWGSPFKAEAELSSFGEQVERYACLYTDRVTNLLRYSASHYFRAPHHRMAHE
jgi:5'-nucleotidase